MLVRRADKGGGGLCPEGVLKTQGGAGSLVPQRDIGPGA